MASIADAVRGSWLWDIHKVTGQQHVSLSEWLLKGNYQFHTDVVHASKFQAAFADSGATSAFAYDVNALSMAAFETLASVVHEPLLRRSTAWLTIRCYYAAFFAAHAMLRIFGVACTRLEADTIARLAEVASLYSRLKVPGLEAGFYAVSATNSRLIDFAKREPKGGAHAALWLAFGSLLERLSLEVIARSAPDSPDREVVDKLDQLKRTLELGGRSVFWLIDTRNAINYKFKFNAWYPFTGNSTSYVDSLFRGASLWTQDAMGIDLRTGGEDIRGFVRCCALIVSMCREMLADIREMCPAGRSFVDFGPHALLSHLVTAQAVA